VAETGARSIVNLGLLGGWTTSDLSLGISGTLNAAPTRVALLVLGLPFSQPLRKVFFEYLIHPELIAESDPPRSCVVLATEYF